AQESGRRPRVRRLGTSSTYQVGDGHYDIDPRSEPFEAVLYGAPREGAEVALEYAVIERGAHQGRSTYAGVMVCPAAAAAQPRPRSVAACRRRDGDAARREWVRRVEQAQRERDARWAARTEGEGTGLRGAGDGSAPR
ncbi:hypothetical protein O1L55_09965, partial [Streptomyces albulus]|nr:hypothetical protein [Streptomyces noursei]